ncbi:MAG: alpha/beta fold hydrolase [Candidatus Acidiferrales bacterium]
MKLWELALAIGGAICLLLGTAWIRRSELPRKDFVLNASGCRVPVTEYDPPANVNPAGSAIVLHGLSANRRVMTYLSEDFAGHGLRTYALDLPGHGDNREPFTFPRAQLCATAAVETLIRSGRIDPRTTVLVGHSMGGAIAIRMADREPVHATIAISPAPMKLPMRMPANLLVFTAQFDIPPLVKEAKDLEAAAGGDRNAPEDFAQLRAFDLERIPFASHTSLLLDRRVAHQSELWVMRALFPNVATETLTLNVDLATYETFNFGRRRLAGAVLGLIGLVLLFPLAATVVVQLFGQIFRTAGIRADSGQATGLHKDPRSDSSSRVPGRALVLVEGIVSALIGVAALILFVPLKFLHLYSGDYLASLLLIYGVLLLILNRSEARATFSLDMATKIAAVVLGIGTILSVGAWLNWQLTDGWLNAPRWLRFCALVPMLWIFAYAEEVVLGPVNTGSRRTIRFALAMALRLEIWLVCVFAYYEMLSGQVLILLLVTALAMFSIFQRLGTDAVRRRTGSSPAAALFGAILGAWLIASVFPLT